VPPPPPPPPHHHHHSYNNHTDRLSTSPNFPEISQKLLRLGLTHPAPYLFKIPHHHRTFNLQGTRFLIKYPSLRKGNEWTERGKQADCFRSFCSSIVPLVCCAMYLSASNYRNLASFWSQKGTLDLFLGFKVQNRRFVKRKSRIGRKGCI